jgi:ABC-2 type transport system ATP-binding protein
MTTIIEVEQLVHRFGTRTALDGLSFRVQEGEVFGMLGPNGAGKTTSVRILNGVLAPTSGKVRVFGLDPVVDGGSVRLATGVLTETPSLYERLTGLDNLLTFGALYRVPESEVPIRAAEVLAQFGLTARASDLVGTYSKGMKQRLALARAFLHLPKILFLDEPTAALDPEAARQVSELIEEQTRKYRVTVVLATHNLDEAQRLCDRVAVLNQGRLLACGTQDELARTLWHGTWVDIRLAQSLSDAAAQRVRGLAFVEDVELGESSLAVRVAHESDTPDLIRTLAGDGARILAAVPRRHTLEEIYFSLNAEAR